MKVIEKISLAVGTCLLTTAGFTADFDGSKNMICASMDVMECVQGKSCETVSPEDINAPSFITLDVDSMEMAIKRKEGSAKREIRNKEHLEGRLIIQGVGVDSPVGWTLTINEETGKMVITASGD